MEGNKRPLDFKDPEHQILLQHLKINSDRCTDAMKRSGVSLVWNCINSVLLIVSLALYLIK